MPTLTISKKGLQEDMGKKVSDEVLQEKIPMMGTVIEEMHGDDIVIEIFPNRPDLLSQQGIARALSAFLGVKTGLRNYAVKKSGEKVIVEKSVSKVRPFTACAIIKGLSLSEEKIENIIQIQEKLHITYGRNRKKAAIGVYPLDKLAFPITYYAEDPKKVTFTPLEGKEMTALQILSQHPKGKDYAHLLEGQPKFPFFKDAENQILSMPPIINSNTVGKVEKSTKELFVECSGFDLEYLKKLLNIIVTALGDMGGDIYSVEVEYEKKSVTPDLTPAKMKIDYEYINKLLGMELTRKEIEHSLEKVGFGIEKGHALIPAWRVDILHQADVVEAAAIGYGYDKVVPVIPQVATMGKENPFERWKEKFSEILVGMGFMETETFNLTSEVKQTKRMETTLPVVKLHNALNTEYDVLRAWVLPSLMEVLQNNLSHEYPQLIFGIGRIFKKGKSESGFVEQERLAITICNDKADYTAIKQVLQYLMKVFDTEYEVEATEHSSFIPGRVGRVSVNGKNVAYIGEVNPQVLQNWDLEVPVAALELNLSELFTS